MASNVPPIPHTAPMLDMRGTLTPVWSDFFQKILQRVGGNIAQTNIELEGTKNTGTSGYLILPGGIYIQWGITGALSSASTTSISFPIAFPNGCLQVVSGIRNNSAVAVAATGQQGTGNYSTSAFELYNRTSVTQTFNWLAVGF